MTESNEVIVPEETASNTLKQYAPPQQNNVPTVMNLLMDPTFYEYAMKWATQIAMSPLTPAHLKKGGKEQTIANCFRIVVQSAQWNFNPFSVAEQCYEVHGRLGYEGKLVASAVNTMAGLKSNLNFEHEGEGNDRTCYAFGTLEGEDKPRKAKAVFKECVTYDKNGKINGSWRKQVDQKLSYNAAINWCRMHKPEVLHGVRTIDEVQQMAVNEEVDPNDDDVTLLLDSESDPVTPPESVEEIIDAEYEQVAPETTPEPSKPKPDESAKKEPEKTPEPKGEPKQKELIPEEQPPSEPPKQADEVLSYEKFKKRLNLTSLKASLETAKDYLMEHSDNYTPEQFNELGNEINRKLQEAEDKV